MQTLAALASHAKGECSLKGWGTFVPMELYLMGPDYFNLVSTAPEGSAPPPPLPRGSHTSVLA